MLNDLKRPVEFVETTMMLLRKGVLLVNYYKAGLWGSSFSFPFFFYINALIKDCLTFALMELTLWH